MNRALKANGLKTWNWYVIVNRDNWYHSPTNQFGRETGSFAPHKEVVDLANRIKLHTLDRAPAVSLVTLRRQRLTDSGNWQGLWRSLTKSGIDFETVDCRYAVPGCSLIFYGGSSFIEEDEAANLVRAVEEGATLAVFNAMPKRTRSGAEINPFGLPEGDGFRPVMSPFSIAWEGENIAIPAGGHGGRVQTLYFNTVPEGALPVYACPAGNAETLVDIKSTGASADAYAMGFMKSFGRGRVLLLGMSPCTALLPVIKGITGLSYKIETGTHDTAVTIWENADSRYAFVINRNPLRETVELAVDRRIYPDVNALLNVETGRRWEISKDGAAYITVDGHGVVVLEFAK
jgi:hypothetical protein